MSYVDDLRNQVEEFLRRVDECLDWIATNAPPIIDRLLNIHLATVPLGDWAMNPVADRAKQALAEYVRIGKRIVEILRAEAQFVGSPDNLRAAADGLQNGVITPARALSSRLVLGHIPSALPSNYSDGIASEMYRAAIDGRDAAVRDVETYAAPIVTSLRDLADAIEKYYRQLRDFVKSMLLVILGFAVAIASWETIVPAVLGAVTALVSLIDLVIKGNELLESTGGTRDEVLNAINVEVPEWPAVLR
ncbi:hypothetical protein [uncultured Microbacterium sp.]|uniref:hypothetical protein n=1 Tax=uncultured Microbacterium sp. TaxID=191216 RepID=UPI002600B9BD|nr:hypothetical protein [uncultured Microbacterium sp.]